MLPNTLNTLTYTCPLCHAPLDAAGADQGSAGILPASCRQDVGATLCYVCPRCARSFPVIHGVPDLRPEPEEGMGEELATLLARFDESSLEDLIRLRLNSHRMPADVADLHLTHELVGNERGAERTEQIVRFAGDAVDFSGIALDVGCGMGGMVHALAQRFAWAVGIDVALPDLIIAQKRCQEAGLNNVTFICASAEALPFADGTFAMMNATDVVEHIPRQKLFLSEGYRVLQPGGYFCFNSPNRYNIFGPEPHVNLWGVGFMPRAWMPAYVKLFKGMGYAGKRLLSYLELRHMLRQMLGLHGIRNGTASVPYKIFGTAIRASSARKGWKHRLAFRYPFLVNLANRFLKPFVPQYEVVVSKPR